MSYVGAPFTHDLFISYSHGDDGSGAAFLRPWSAAFAQALERELRADRKFRSSLSVFLDEDHRPDKGIDPMSALSDQLRRQIGDAALLLVLMSPDYLASQWCAQERDWWCARQAELGLATDGRIAVVRIWPTDEPWPAALRDPQGHDLVGFAFHTRDQLPARPLGWTELPGPFGTEFRKALLDIVGRLYPRLEELKVRVEALQHEQADAARLIQAGGQCLYLHGRADHAEAWEKAGIALTDSGFAVVPGEPEQLERDPARAQAARERRVEALSSCDALLLLATADTGALDADLVTVGRNDRQSARARCNRLLPCGLLNTVGEPIATPMRKATARNLQADWIDSTHPEWTPRVHDWLTGKGVGLEQAS
jgi:hypothetical protein